MSTAISKPAKRYPFSVMRERMRARGADVIDFAIGAQTVEPPTSVVELVRAEAPRAIRRRSRDEHETLLDRAAAMMQREYGISVSPEQVVPAPGGRAAISALATAMLSSGDKVLVTEPGYPAFASVAAHQGAETIAAGLDAAREFRPQLADLGVPREAIRLVGLNYPNNPTGAAVPDDMLEALAPHVADDAVIFNDAVYAPLVYDRQPRSMLDATDNVLELHSLGKLFGTGPMGLAFLIGAPELVQRIQDYGDFAWTPSSSLAARVASACLDDGEHFARTRTFFGARIERLRTALQGLGLEPFPTPSGMYVLCPVPAEIRGEAVQGAWEAAERLLDVTGLAVMPFAGPGRGYIRFSGLHRDTDIDALRALGSL